MSEELDAGPILRQEKKCLNHTETFGSLHQVLSELGAKNLLQTLNNINVNRKYHKMKSSLVMPQRLKNWIQN